MYVQGNGIERGGMEFVDQAAAIKYYSKLGWVLTAEDETGIEMSKPYQPSGDEVQDLLYAGVKYEQALNILYVPDQGNG